MRTLADHVQASTPDTDQVSSMIHHVGTIADSASALASDLGVPSLPSLPGLPSVTATVDHVLGAASLPELPSLSSATATVDHALQAVSLPELPLLPAVTATVDHALAPVPELPALPSVSTMLDHVLGAAALPDISAIHADLPAAVLGATAPVVDHVAAPIVEAAPLQIGFLGQSYTDVNDPHDLGSHGIGSMLHGLV
jgi:hypothetical protein